MSRGTAISDAIVAELVLQSRPWNSNGVIAASRSWLPVYKPSDVQNLRVSVFSMTMENVKQARPGKGSTWETYGTIIDFQIAAGFDTSTGLINQAPLDAVDVQAEQIFDFYQDAHRITAAGVQWVIMQANRADIYDLQRLYSDEVWETAVALVIKGQV